MRAAQYVRMSTEHQQYSIENQQVAIAQYARHMAFVGQCRIAMNGFRLGGELGYAAFKGRYVNCATRCGLSL
jgi:hypothetical protein